MKKNPSSTRRGKIRLLIQACFAALSNGYINGFINGKIFKGPSKYVCVPGMNCYSCPGALGSCPIGSLQATLGSREYKVSMYVIGTLVIFGTILGRFVCGFLCPFGLIQDLLFKIPFVKKIRKLPGERGLRWLRFVFLGIFVILLPMFVVDITGLGEPWFCKYICPITVFLKPMSYFSLFRIHCDESKCVKCGKCLKVCPMNVECNKESRKRANATECILCFECKKACPVKAIK